jgi:LacI family transcriptional regulator
MATIYEVSELAGVSLATVSRVMNDSGRVSRKTTDKVLAAMKQLDYQPNSVAQSLASNRSNCVGVLVSEVTGPVFAAMLGGIESELREAGKFTIFATGHTDKDKEREGIRFMIGRNCDALILHVEALSDDYLIENQDGATPFVIINRSVGGLEDRCIVLDNEKGGYLATRSVIERGHRDIAYISGPLDWGDASERFDGHRRALREAGIEFDETLLVEGDYHEAGGGRALYGLLQSGTPFTAVVCGNDEMAAGAMETARAQALRIPEELSIVGFDNAPLCSYLYPKLSTVNYPVADMGRMAARWVLKNVYEQDSGDIQTLFQPRFVTRASIATMT